MNKHSRGIFSAAILGITFLLAGNCDVLVKKNNVTGRSSDSDNVFLESRDKGVVDPEEDRTIYYKIYLNKEIAAKTSSGLFFQKKKLSLRLSPGRYLFFAERWYLDESPESSMREYKRANNVWQMKLMYIDIPEGGEPFKMTFGIDHDRKEFYYEIEGQKNPEIPTTENPATNQDD